MTVEDIDFSRFKYCECNCGELIPIINTKGKPARFKNHHNIGLKKEKSLHWNGGQHIKDGYIVTYKPDHPKCNKTGYIKQHRIIYEEFYKCCLLPNSVVHHIDKNRQNNNIENLMVFVNHSTHEKFEKKVDMSNRYCLICNNKTWKTKNGNELWYCYNDGFKCKRCYDKHIKR